MSGMPTGELLPNRALLVEHLGLRLAEPGRGACLGVGGHATVAGGGFGRHGVFASGFSRLFSSLTCSRMDDLHTRRLWFVAVFSDVVVMQRLCRNRGSY